MTIRVRKATENQRRTKILASGEFVFCDDSKKLYLGNGTENPKEISYRQLNEKIICSNLIFSFNTESDSIEISPVEGTTDSIFEGTYNKYFTKKRVTDILYETFSKSNNEYITFLYDSMNNVVDAKFNSAAIENVEDRMMNDVDLKISNVYNVIAEINDNIQNVVKDFVDKKTKELVSELINNFKNNSISTKEFAVDNKILINENVFKIDGKTIFKFDKIDENLEIVGGLRFKKNRQKLAPTSNLIFKSLRGKVDDPQPVQPNDVTSLIEFYGWNGKDYALMGLMAAQVHAHPNPTSFNIDSKLVFLAGTDNTDKAISIDKHGILRAPVLQTGVYNNISDRDAAIPIPQNGMIILLLDTGSGFPKFQGYVYNNNSKTGQWVDIG